MTKKKELTVEIDGVNYTPVYNFNVMAKFGEKYGLYIDDFSKLTNPTIKQLIDLAFFGIQEYCRINKMDVPFDVFKIGELEGEKISLLIQSISVNMMKLPKVERN